jgi:hypothetical protein
MLGDFQFQFDSVKYSFCLLFVITYLDQDLEPGDAASVDYGTSIVHYSDDQIRERAAFDGLGAKKLQEALDKNFDKGMELESTELKPFDCLCLSCGKDGSNPAQMYLDSNGKGGKIDYTALYDIVNLRGKGTELVLRDK